MKVWHLLLVAVSLIVIVVIGAIAYQSETPRRVTLPKPYYCTTPYSIEYCKANQAEMYALKVKKGEL